MLQCRNRPCACNPCLSFRYEECELVDYLDGNAVEIHRIERAEGLAVRRRTRKAAYATFAKDVVKPGVKVVVRVARDEPDNPHREPHFLAIAMGAARRTTKAEKLATAQVSSKEWVVPVRWLRQDPTAQQRQFATALSEGTRVYRIKAREQQLVVAARHCVPDAHVPAQQMHGLRTTAAADTNSAYALPAAAHSAIMQLATGLLDHD